MEKEEKDDEMFTKGKYGGVGIQIGLRKTINSYSPMDQSPAKRAGILRR